MPETPQCALNVEKLEWMTTLDTATAVEAKDSTTVIGGLIHRYLTQISFGSGVGLYEVDAQPMPSAAAVGRVGVDRVSPTLGG